MNQNPSEQLEQLNQTVAEQKRVLDKLTVHLTQNKETLYNLAGRMAARRSTKWGRIQMLLHRFKVQVLRGDKKSRKDFQNWTQHILAKFLPIKKAADRGLPLYDFDPNAEEYADVLKLLAATDRALAMQLGVNSNGILPKQGRQFFIFAGVPYYDVGGGQRFAQIANALNNMGYTVHYIYGYESDESRRENMYIPCAQHVYLGGYTVEDMAADIHPGDVLIFEIPYAKFKPYMDYANEHGNPTVYEHVDNWDSDLGSRFFRRDDFAEFIRDVKHVTVTARVLGEKIQEAGREEYVYCPNAVDSSLFEPTKVYPKPADLITGKQTLLYFGSLWGEWFDWDLVIHVAKTCDCEITMIGDYKPIEGKIKSMPKNIHFLGLKKHEELPAYLQHCDITLLPFKKSLIGKYVSPLKVFEYIAMNKPVLATPLDDIMGYPNMVASEDPKVWEDAVKNGIPTVDATVFTAENSWYARCNQILDMVGRPEGPKPSISSVILNHNNMKVIFRCVDSLLAFSDAYDMEIIVVDNDSTDGSYEKLLETYGDKIKVIKNPKNGCSCGRNLGVQHATKELLLFLDSDQWIIGDHFLDAALEVLEQNKNIGAVGWAAGWFSKDSPHGPIADYLPQRGIPGPWAMSRSDIAYLGSGGLVMAKSLFEQIEGFDEFYDPTCFEDTDLSLKIRHAGYELAYCTYTSIMHLPHQTTGAGSAAHTKLLHRNGNYFMDKWKKLNPKLLEYYG